MVKSAMHHPSRMRDDIHKNAPVPRRWQTFIRVCANDAEDVPELRRRLSDAMNADAACLRDAVPALRQRLLEQAACLPGVRDLDALRSLPRAGDGMAVSIAVENAIRLADEVGADAVDMTRVVELSLDEVRGRRFRQIENHLCQKFERYRPELMRRVHAADRGFDTHSLVRSTEDGTLSAKPSRKPALNLDEGLSLALTGTGHG